jgi:hypothetical protein
MARGDRDIHYRRPDTSYEIGEIEAARDRSARSWPQSDRMLQWMASTAASMQRRIGLESNAMFVMDMCL